MKIEKSHTVEIANTDCTCSCCVVVVCKVGQSRERPKVKKKNTDESTVCSASSLQCFERETQSVRIP